MLCRRKIELSTDITCLQRTFISREALEESAQVEQLFRHAQHKADELLILAERERVELLAVAELEFWQRANAQLKQWEAAKKAMCDNLERYATEITNQAIEHLLGDTLQPQRVAALVKQLLATQMPEVAATLLCHPSEVEEMKQCLIHHQATLWKLQPDESIAAQTLVLKTDEGDFHISWACISATFLKQDYQPTDIFHRRNFYATKSPLPTTVIEIEQESKHGLS
jgi:type III secretion apparatus protein, HrpE/YscL family